MCLRASHFILLFFRLALVSMFCSNCWNSLLIAYCVWYTSLHNYNMENIRLYLLYRVMSESGTDLKQAQYETWIKTNACFFTQFLLLVWKIRTIRFSRDVMQFLMFFFLFASNSRHSYLYSVIHIVWNEIVLAYYFKKSSIFFLNESSRFSLWSRCFFSFSGWIKERWTYWKYNIPCKSSFDIHKHIHLHMRWITISTTKTTTNFK